MYEMVLTSCNTPVQHFVSISVLLTITHLTLLMIAEHVILTSSMWRPLEQFTGRKMG